MSNIINPRDAVDMILALTEKLAEMQESGPLPSLNTDDEFVLIEAMDKANRIVQANCSQRESIGMPERHWVRIASERKGGREIL